MAADVPAGIDPIVTCSTGHLAEPVKTTVRVTHLEGGKAVSDEWVVPTEDRRRCG
jgi:hypothetical protein